MDYINEFYTNEYQDLGMLGYKESVRLKRHKSSGLICIEKSVPYEKYEIYEYLKNNNIKGIPEIYFCIKDGERLTVMEKYIEGITLEEIVSNNPMDEKRIVKGLLDLCRCLKKLHQAENPIICRDIKAENVIVDKDGKFWLVDFNIARIYREGKHRDTELLGTAEYAAPEQFGFFQTDNRTDIYSLGVLTNYMATQKFPVEKMVSGKLGKIVEKCTFLDPEKRYQTIEELERDLLHYFPEETEETVKMMSSEKLPPGFRKNILWHKMVSCIGYLLITLFYFSMDMNTETVTLPDWALWLERFIMWAGQIMFVLIAFNYRGIRDKVILLNSRNIPLKMAGIIIAEVILTLVSLSLCAMVDMIIA